METAERGEGKLGLWKQQREEGKLRLWRQHGNTVAKISLVYEISLQALWTLSEHVSEDVCHSCNNVFTYSSITHPEGYLKYVTASGKLIVTRYDHLLSIPRTVQREFFSKKQHTQVNHVSSCFITQGAVVCFSLFPPPRVPITLSSPVTPSPTTLQISQLHYINLPC